MQVFDKLLLTLSITIININIAIGQDYKFRHISVENGLSNSETNTIVQDKEGFIWIGTSDGLNRYDGHSFKVYRKIANDSTSLQNNNIKYLFLDSWGELWIGTDRGGLSRYNKESDCFINYLTNSSNNKSLLSNHVTGIVEDNQKNIWVSTYGGLNQFDRKNNCFNRLPDNPEILISANGVAKLKNSIPEYFVKSLYTLQGQKIRSNNLYQILKNINKEMVTKYFDSIFIMLGGNAVLSPDIRCLISDHNGNMIIGYGNGFISMFNLNKKSFTHYKFTNPKERVLVDFFVTSFCVNENKIWIGTRGEGVWILNTQTGKFSKFDKLKERFVNSIARDSKGNILIGGAESGLMIYNEKENSFREYLHDDFDKFSLSANAISCIYEDRQKNLWIGCIQNDLNVTTSTNPFHMMRQNLLNSGELSNRNVSAVMEEDDHTIWVGYYNIGGIDIINRETHQKKHLSPKVSGLGESSVYCIFKDSRSNVWIGTYLGGLQMYDKKTGRFITYSHDPKDNRTIAGNDVRKIIEDHEGNLWIAVHGGGVDMFDLKTKQFIHHKVNYEDYQNSIASDWVLSLLCDRQDQIWVGSIEGISLIKKNTTHIINYKNQPKDPKSLSNNFVYVINQDSRGTMWFGTSFGLNRFDFKSETFQSFTKNDGLPNDNVSGILEDRAGNLWISTFNGLSRFNPDRRTFKNFDVQDGLATNEFFIPTGFRSKSGELFFGGRDGLVIFNPKDIKDNSYNFPVVLTDFKLFNQSANIKGTELRKGFYLDKQITFLPELSLHYDQNVFTFEFVALNYVRPEKNQYAYMLEGFDKQWNFIGTKNDVTYTNLPNGKYTFRVRASNNDGIWSENGASIRIVITPPWWKTFWAYLSYVLICFLLMFFLRYSILQRERFKRKIEMERMEATKLHEIDLMKLRFFTNISHEFRTPLTLILAPLEKPFQLLEKEKLETTYNLIYRNANRLLRLINQLMDFSKMDAGGLMLQADQKDIVGFVREIAGLFNYQANERRIDFKIVSDINELTVWFDSDKLEKILYNLISNAFKFTSAGDSISVQIGQKNETSKKNIEIIIEDTGMGIKPEDLTRIFDKFYQADTSRKNMGTGIGLSLTKELVELHKGTIKAESEYGKGTRFILSLPLGNEHLDQHQLVTDEPSRQTFLVNSEFPSANEEKYSGSGKNTKQPILLVVEDHPDLSFYIKFEFEKSFHVISAIDGLQGLEMALTHIPDIIISDIMMPEMDGMELCKKLKTDERTSHIPVILLTARSSEEQVVQGLETGADDYIIKPFNISVLRARVYNLIESRMMLRKQFSKLPDVSQAVTTSSLDQKFLERACKLIESNIENSNFDAYLFANEIGMSRSQLYRKVQALTGYSVNEFIRNFRLKKAAELLIRTDHNITETAFNVGFKEVTYFVKCFTGFYGISPAKFRQSNKNLKEQSN